MNNNRGLIHIICGNGKGKSTSAAGCALRACGSGLRVHFAQLMKSGDSGEVIMLKKTEGITTDYLSHKYPFTFEMGSGEKESLICEHNRILAYSQKLMADGKIDFLVLDELLCACEYSLCDMELAREIVLHKPEKCELVLTGRNAPMDFINAADYVSQIDEIKHPYQKGICARKGIEY